MSHELLIVLIEPDTPEEEIIPKVNALIRPHSNLDDPDTMDYECDGWVIGGRFDGMIHGAEMEYNLKPQQFQERYGMYFEKVELRENVRLVSDVDETFLKNVNTVLTLDGEWTCCFDSRFKHEDVLNPTHGDKWKNFLSDVLTANYDKLAVLVDIHN